MNAHSDLPNQSSQPSARQPVNYCSYLVRLWRDQPHAPWRTSVQHVQTGEIVRFASIETLCRYLTDHATERCDDARVESPIDSANP